MKGFPQGVAVILLCLASACWTQDVLESSQVYDPLAEGQQVQEPISFSGRRQSSRSRTNASRRLQRYRKKGMPPMNEEEFSENVEGDPVQSDSRSWETNSGKPDDDDEDSYHPQDTREFQRNRPNSRIGFRRRVDRFRSRELAFNLQEHQDTEDNGVSEQGGGSDDSPDFSESFHMENKNEFSQDRGQVKFEQQDRRNQNINNFRVDSRLTDTDENNTGRPITPSFDRQSQSAYDVVNDQSFSGNDGQVSSGQEEQIHIIEAVESDDNNNQWQNNDSQLQDQQPLESINESEGTIVKNGENFYPRVRIQPGPNSGRRRLRGPHRRRFMRLRRPNGRNGFLRRNLRLGFQQKNLESDNQEKLINDHKSTAGGRIIDPLLLRNPNEKAQKILSLPQNSRDLQGSENERQGNRENTYLPDSQSNSEGFRESKSFSPQNESPDVAKPSKSDISSRIITPSDREQFNDINQNTPRANFFHRIPNSKNLRSRLQRPNDNSLTEGSYKENNRFDEVNNPTREHIESPEHIQSGQFSQREQPLFSQQNIIPVQFIENHQQQPEEGDNTDSGFDQNSPSRQQQGPADQISFSKRIGINEQHQEKSANDQNLHGNQELTNDQGFVSQQQFGNHHPVLRTQLNNDQRLYQFQQQIEMQRLLQYPQQQMNDQGISQQPQKSAQQQRQQILDDQRLLQYPQQQINSHSLPTPLHNINHQDSAHIEQVANTDQLLQGPQLQDDQAMPFQKDQQHFSPQYLVNQYFKPAQLSDAFGPGRNIANDRIQQQSFTRKPSLGHREGTNVNIDNSGYLHETDVNQQSRLQNAGRFSTSEENIDTRGDRARFSSRINEQPNERNKENLNFSQQQNRQPQNIHRQSVVQSHFLENIRRPERPSAGQQRNDGDARLTFPRIPGRVEPSDAGSSSSRTTGIHSNKRIPNTPTSRPINAGSDDAIRFGHGRQTVDASFTQNSFNNQNTFPTQNNVKYSSSAPDRISQSVTTTPTQNRQLTEKKISLRPFDIQRNPSNINGEGESFNRGFSQGNEYLSNQNNRVGHTQRGQFTSPVRSQTFDTNIGQEFDSRDKQVSRNRDNQWTLTKESQVVNIREEQISDFQQNPDIKFNEGQVLDNRQSDLSSVKPHQPSEFSQGQTFSVEQGQIPNQSHNQHKQTTNFIQAPPRSFRRNPFAEFRQGQTSGFSQQQVSDSSQVQDQHSQSDSVSLIQNQLPNAKQYSPINHPALDVNVESDTPQYQASTGRAEGGFHQEPGTSGIQSINDQSHTLGNIQTASQQNLNQGRFHQRPGTYSHGRPSFDQSKFNSAQDSSQRGQNYSSNQGHRPIPEPQSPFQDGGAREQSTLSRQPLKPTNAHGQPGFTYQRNFDSDAFDNYEDHELRGRQSITDDTRQDGISSPDGDTTPQSQFQNESPSSSSRLETNKSPDEAAERPNQSTTPLLEQTTQEVGRKSSISPASGRGNRKFIDTLKGISSELPKKDLIETIAAMLQGRDYFDQRVVTTKLQRISSEPRLTEIPETGFRCAGRVSGYYADAHNLAKCQSFHFCGVDGTKISYLCPAGTVFNQRLLVCDHVFRVECSSSPDFYHVNERLYGANVHQPLRDISRAFRSFGRRI